MDNTGLEITLIELSKIHPNPYNPNRIEEGMLAKLRLEISQKGLKLPILVRSGQSGGYEIVDGYHRWLICQELGMTAIPCIIQDFTDTEAKIKCLQMNYLRGSAVPIKLASLIHDLNREMTLEDLEKRLPYEKPQMMDSLELLKLPDNYGRDIEERAKIEMGRLPFVIAFIVYKEQSQVIEEAINIARQELPDGTKNSKALALEMVCAEYVAQQKVKTKIGASVEAG